MAEVLTELHKMLVSCGEDYKTMGELAKLWCGILAGHITRLLAKKVSNIELSAPVFIIPDKSGRFNTLKRIVESVVVEAPLQSKKEDDCFIKMVYPHIICSKSKTVSLNKLAFMEFHWFEKHDIPLEKEERAEKFYDLPLYCMDDGLLIYFRNIKRNVRPFLERNRWVTTILLDGKEKQSPVEPVEFDAFRLSDCTDDWDISKVQILNHFLIGWMYKRLAKTDNSYAQELWNKAQNLIVEYNAIHPKRKLRGQQEIWATLLVIPALLFSEMISEKCDAETGDHWHDELLNLLLPGVCPAPDRNKPLE